MTSRHLAVWLLLLLFAGCISQSPFVPAPVRFGRVDYLETREAPAEPLALSLNRDTCAPTGAVAATLVVEPALAAQKPPARFAVLRDGREVAQLNLPEVRNTQLDARVELRCAPAGTYFLRVRVGEASVEKSFVVR